MYSLVCSPGLWLALLDSYDRVALSPAHVETKSVMAMHYTELLPDSVAAGASPAAMLTVINSDPGIFEIQNY